MTGAGFFQNLFTGYTDEQLQAGADAIVAKSRLIRAVGWGHHAKTWSKGEVHAVALALNDQLMIDDLGETRETILGKMAYTNTELFTGTQTSKPGTCGPERTSTPSAHVSILDGAPCRVVAR